ncbi:MAG: 3-isopropylmalate dehydratase large subunit [Gammaproteobacteria bacterium]|nr:3-isopropylmalate dehydratase large subunit [Gammaproteobacteria bacterium]MCP4881861.1 3-isopropylmalate dehydratase large subunit [Gammaproteobacteria bacterium]
MARTLYDKLLDTHKICDLPDGDILVYVDFHIMNEYTSPQAFSGLGSKGLSVRQPEAHLAIVDHVNSTQIDEAPDPVSKLLIDNLEANCEKHQIACYGLKDPRQGIEHVVVPEQGIVAPGMLIACGDSHTTTYGALGALGFGIGTSEVEHVLATQTLRYQKLKNMRINVAGQLSAGITAKDIIMHVIRKVGAGAANGYAVEFAGQVIEQLDMAGRMTVCNMAVELGARAALIAADQKTLSAMEGKAHSGRCAFDKEIWQTDIQAVFDREVYIDCKDIEPLVTWGISPDQAVAIGEKLPVLEQMVTDKQQSDFTRAMEYMGLAPGQSIVNVPIDMAFIGSCTNSRIDDLRAAAEVLRGKRVASGVVATVIPGSASTKVQAELEGIDQVFIDAGFDWRPQSGCSMCLAMNDDIAENRERIASSTNRNFEGRQGRGARTHLMSPAMVAAAAVAGKIVDVRLFTQA